MDERLKKPRTAEEYNLFHINRLMEELKNGTTTVKEAGLNKRFKRLEQENIAMYQELYPKYVDIVREISLRRTN